MRLHVIDLAWVEYGYVTLCGFGGYRKAPLVRFAKIIFADSLQWPVCNYLLCNKKDSSHCNNLILQSCAEVRGYGTADRYLRISVNFCRYR